MHRRSLKQLDVARGVAVFCVVVLWLVLPGAAVRAEDPDAEADRVGPVPGGLYWLRNHQHPDGYWSSQFGSCCKDTPPCSDRARRSHPELEEHESLTGLAMLAFLGFGHTHKDGDFPSFVQAMKAAQQWLLTQQRPDGRFGRSHTSHAIVTMALAELLVLSQDRNSALPGAVDRATTLCMRDLDHDVFPGSDLLDDETGLRIFWQVLALKTSKACTFMNLIEVEKSEYGDRFEVARSWFEERTDAVTGEVGGGSFHRDTHRLRLTAGAVLGRLFCGDRPKVADVRRGCALVMVAAADHHDTVIRDPLFVYMGSYALFQCSGPLFRHWKASVLPAVASASRPEGCEWGSWDPAPGGGRVYTTAVCVMALEVYYRFVRQGGLTDLKEPEVRNRVFLEPSVGAAQWLQRHQHADGHWSAREWTGVCRHKKKCAPGAGSGATLLSGDIAVTARVVDALRGQTSSAVSAARRRAVQWLLTQQRDDGRFTEAESEGPEVHAWTVRTIIDSIDAPEGEERDAATTAATRSLPHCIQDLRAALAEPKPPASGEASSPDLPPTEGPDPEGVRGLRIWLTVDALCAARDRGIELPEDTNLPGLLKAARRWFARRADPITGEAGTEDPAVGEHRLRLSALSVLTRLRTGAAADLAELRKSAWLLAGSLPDTVNGAGDDGLYPYFAARAVIAQGGDPSGWPVAFWESWRQRQVDTGCAEGSWGAADGRGRLLATTDVLEIIARALVLFTLWAEEDADADADE